MDDSLMNTKSNNTVNKISGSRNYNTSNWLTSGLRGDSFDYVIHGTCRDAILGVELNSDSTNNYRLYNMQGSGSSASASVSDSTTITQAFGSTTSGKPSAFRLIITGDSSTEKHINSFVSLNAAINVRAIYWKNTSSELTSINIFDTTSRTANVDIWIEQVPKQANLQNYDLVEKVDFVGRDLNANPIVFSGLDGDSDGEYLIIGKKSMPISNNSLLTINGDTGSNYKDQYLTNAGGVIGAANGTQSFINLGYAVGTYNSFVVNINAVSGRKRLVSVSAGILGNINQAESDVWYNNTADNITSLELKSTFSSSPQTGSIKLYRRKSNKTIDPVPMKTVIEHDITGVDFSAGITLNNIEGDRIDGAIKIECIDMVGNTNLTIQANSITSNSNQELKASSSSTSASPTSPTKNTICAGSTSVNGSETWIYPKSGQNRPCLNKQYYNENTIEFNGIWINDSSSELVSLLIQADSSTSLNCKIRVSIPINTKQTSPSWTKTVN